MNYTEGIYNNRSAAHFFLHNYRSAIVNARIAWNTKGYAKTKVRILKRLLALKKYEEARKEVEQPSRPGVPQSTTKAFTVTLMNFIKILEIFEIKSI